MRQVELVEGQRIVRVTSKAVAMYEKPLSESILGKFPSTQSTESEDLCVPLNVPEGTVVKFKEFSEEVLEFTPVASLIERKNEKFFFEHAAFLLRENGFWLARIVPSDCDEVNEWTEISRSIREELQYIDLSKLTYFVSRFHQFIEVDGERTQETMHFVVHYLPPGFTFMDMVDANGDILPETTC